MSCVEVYQVLHNGDVTPYDFEVRNATAGAYHIWSTLCEKYLHVPFSGLQPGTVQALWLLVGSGRMTPGEDWVLAFTFDNTWIRRENLPELIRGLEEFWENHSSFRSGGWDCLIKQVNVHPTIPGLIEVFKRAWGDEILRGLAFNQTSVNSNPWRVKIPYSEMVVDFPDLVAEDYCQDPETRPFNLDKDTNPQWGPEPREVGDLVSSFRKHHAKDGF